jgi:hypothetical protein
VAADPSRVRHLREIFPTAPVTRGQLVAFLCRAHELRIADPSLTPGSASTDPSVSPAVC